MLDGLVGLVTRHRIAVVLGLLAVTAALGSQIPRIQADPAPESLISSFKEQEQAVIARFERSFGDTERVMVILVEAPKVLEVGPLQYVHDLTLGLREMSWIDRTEGLTTLPLPRRHREENGGESLDDLDDLGMDRYDGQGASLDDLADLDDAAAGEESVEEQERKDKVLNALLAVIEADPDRFPGGIAELGPRLQREVRSDPIVQGERVTPEAVRELAMTIEQSPLLMGRLVSEDRKVAAIALHLKALESRTMFAAMEELRDYLDAHDPPSGVHVHIGGLSYLRSEMISKMRNDQIRLIPATLLVFLLLLYASFRWVPGMLLPIAAVCMPVVMVVGGMAIAGQPMNVLNNIIPPLLIIIGISDSIHIVSRYLEESGRCDRVEAGRRTIRTMTIACLLTSATTAVGLASNVVSTTVMLRTFGLIAGIGVMVSYAVKILFLPSVLTWVKPRPAERSKAGWLDSAIMTMTARILRHPWWVLGGTAIFIGFASYAAWTVRRDHALLDQFDPSDPVSQTTRLLEDKFEGVRPLELYLRSDQEGRFREPEIIAAIERIEHWADARHEVIRTMSHSDLVRALYFLLSDDPAVRTEPIDSSEIVAAIGQILAVREPSPLSAWMTPDGKEARVRISVRDVGAQATLRLIDDLKKEVDRELHGMHVDASFLGEAYNGSRGQTAVVADLTGSLGTAIVAIFVMLVLLFRSVRLALLSIPPYLVPLLGTAAYMKVRDIPLNTANVIIFSISIGMAVDGTIHVLERFRQETSRGLRSNAALVRAARGTGRSILVACLTLSAGFSVLLLSSFVPVRRFGELIAVTIAMCILATLIVQPALLKVMGTSRSRKEAQRAEDARIAAAARARHNGASHAAWDPMSNPGEDDATSRDAGDLAKDPAPSED